MSTCVSHQNVTPISFAVACGGEAPRQISILERRTQEESQQANLLINKDLQIGSLEIQVKKMEKEIEELKAQIETLQAQLAAK